MDKALIILGASGNLGSKIAKHYTFHDDFSVYKGVRGDAESTLPALTSISLIGGGAITIPLRPEEMRKTFSSSEVTVINCSSARFPLSSQEISYANVTWPKFLFDSLIDCHIQKLKWIQFESYWQYSSSAVIDKNYVDSKNQLSIWLANESRRLEVDLVRIVLPHLFGRDDNPSRYIPKLLRQIQMGRLVEISNAEEVWPLTDFMDIVNYIDDISQLFLTPHELHSFPSHPTSLLDFANLAVTISGSESRVSRVENSQGFSPLPTLSFSDQPKLVDYLLTPLSNSVAEIFAMNLEQPDKLLKEAKGIIK